MRRLFVAFIVIVLLALLTLMSTAIDAEARRHRARCAVGKVLVVHSGRCVARSAAPFRVRTALKPRRRHRSVVVEPDEPPAKPTRAKKHDRLPQEPETSEAPAPVEPALPDAFARSIMARPSVSRFEHLQ